MKGSYQWVKENKLSANKWLMLNCDCYIAILKNCQNRWFGDLSFAQTHIMPIVYPLWRLNYFWPPLHEVLPHYLKTLASIFRPSHITLKDGLALSDCRYAVGVFYILSWGSGGVVPVRVLSMGSMDVFANCLYLKGILDITEPCAKNLRNYIKNV